MLIIYIYSTPWKRIATYQVPQDLPACPEGGCHCAWLWVSHYSLDGALKFRSNPLICVRRFSGTQRLWAAQHVHGGLQVQRDGRNFDRARRCRKGARVLRRRRQQVRPWCEADDRLEPYVALTPLPRARRKCIS